MLPVPSTEFTQKPIGIAVSKIMRYLTALPILLCCLSSCGGGTGNSSPQTAATDSVLSAAKNAVMVSAQTSNDYPKEAVRLTVTNPPVGGFQSGVQYTQNGVSYVTLAPESETAANLLIDFKFARDLAPGTYQDSITVFACFDAACNRPFKGSPQNILVTYTVSNAAGVGQVRVTNADDPPEVVGVQGEAAPVFNGQIQIENPNRVPLFVRAETTDRGVANSTAQLTGADQVNVSVRYRAPADLAVAQYEDTTVVSICYDDACSRQVTSAPVRLNTRYLVRPPPLTPLPIASTTPFEHDVIDAEYDAALNSIVVVSSQPRNALYLYNAASGAVKSIDLSKVPTSVSVSPDGNTAAVGHDALISVVTLASIVPGSGLSVRTLNVSAPVGDVVLGGNGYVHAFPAAGQTVNIHTVQISTNTETLNSGRSIYERTKAKLHPNGSSIYGAINGLSPDDIEKYSAPANGAVAYLYDSRYHGEYPMCGDLWFAETGGALYTACGNTFQTADNAAQDIVYSGALSLTRGSYFGYQIRWLSQSSETSEIGLIEHDLECKRVTPGTDCGDHVRFYNSNSLAAGMAYSMPKRMVNGVEYRQLPLFLFHSANGTSRYVIAKTDAASGAAFFLHRMQ